VAAGSEPNAQLFFGVTQIHDVVELFDATTELIRHFQHHQLYKRRAADRLLHPQLTTFHSTG